MHPKSIKGVVLCLLCAFIAIFAAGCFAPSFSGRDTARDVRDTMVTVSVIDSRWNNPIVNARVSLDGMPPVKVDDGKYVFHPIAPGSYRLTAHGPYHHEVEAKVHVTAKDRWIELSLDPVFTEQELYDFAAIIRAEAEGEPYIGQVAVAASILNRWRSPDFPDNLTDIIYQVIAGYYQYSPVLDGRINLGPNASAWKAAGEAIAGHDPSHGATGFFAHDIVGPDSWVRDWPVTAVIGNHTFYLPNDERPVDGALL